MYCPRLDHFVRFNPDGTVSRCGHMINNPTFQSLELLETSEWLEETKEKFKRDEWPKECQRCEQTEEINHTSIRINAIHFDKVQKIDRYLAVGGVLDNICNSACQSCNENLSTKIGGLRTKDYPIVNNTSRFLALPLERIVHLDINGGEPSASKNYKSILQNLPPNVKSVRVNTNCGLIIEELEDLVAQGIKVTVTASFDGIDRVHDYVRWPIKWTKYYKNLMIYKSMNIDLNLWTTVSTLNINNMIDIVKFARDNEIDHSYGLLDTPLALNVKFKNTLTESAKEQLLEYADIKNLADHVAISTNNEEDLWQFVKQQDQLRRIDYEDYYG